MNIVIQSIIIFLVGLSIGQMISYIICTRIYTLSTALLLDRIQTEIIQRMRQWPGDVRIGLDLALDAIDEVLKKAAGGK